MICINIIAITCTFLYIIANDCIYSVLDHESLIKLLGQVAPYGVYVVNENTGFINLGIDHDTSEFAVESIWRWWNALEKNTFPDAKRIYINCDGGGSNGSNQRVWKVLESKMF